MAESKKQHVSLFDGTLVRIGSEVKRFDQGALIPDHADENHVKLLKERGMVGEGEPHVGLTHRTTGPVAFDVDKDAAASRSRSARSGS
jgi:hypothetical protein